MTQKRAGLLSPLTTALAGGAPTGDPAFDTEDLVFIPNQHWRT